MALEIFPSANNVGGGKTGSEERMREWIDSLLNSNFVVSGLDYASASGLDVTFNSGEAMIDGYRIVEDASTVLTMTDNTTNYIYYQLDYDVNGNVTSSTGFVVNTTGSQPSDSIEIATVTTASGSVSSNTDERKVGFTKENVWQSINTYSSYELDRVMGTVSINADATSDITHNFGTQNLVVTIHTSESGSWSNYSYYDVGGSGPIHIQYSFIDNNTIQFAADGAGQTIRYTITKIGA